MTNLIKTFLETSKDRLKNPLIGTFIFAWIAINWKPISVLLFSKESIYFRIDIIEECYSTNWYNLYLPLIIALIYIVVLPYIMWLIDLSLIFAVKKRKKNLFNQQLLNVKGERELVEAETELEEIKAGHRDKVGLNNQIKKLSNSIESKDEIIEELETEINVLKGLEKPKNSPFPSKNELNKNDQERIFKIISKIEKDSGKLQVFDALINAVNNDDFFEITKSNLNDINYFLRTDIVTLASKNVSNFDYRKYTFTKLGKGLRRHYLDKSNY